MRSVKIQQMAMFAHVPTIAAKLWHEGINADNYNQEQATKVLTEHTAAPVYCIRVLTEFEPEVIEILKTYKKSLT